jgi:hypothetical protein
MAVRDILKVDKLLSCHERGGDGNAVVVIGIVGSVGRIRQCRGSW